jgi:hypothetical protein
VGREIKVREEQGGVAQLKGEWLPWRGYSAIWEK